MTSKTRSAAAFPRLTLYEALLIALAGVRMLYANPIKERNAAAVKDLSIITIRPPYHSKTAMVAIPKNSLTGEAKF